MGINDVRVITNDPVKCYAVKVSIIKSLVEIFLYSKLV
jgi:hypothetical protein